MNEKRQQTYLNLINQLLSCNDGDEPRILQENQELLDRGLIETMVAVAQQLQDAGRKNEAQWLMNLAQQLAEALGLLEDETTETVNTSQDYLDFLMEVLQKVADDLSPQLVYSFLAENLDKLDENLIEVLDYWSKNKLSSVDREEAEYIANIIVNFSNLIQQVPLGNIAINNEIAITGYEIALIVFTLEAFPVNWAATQNNLGLAYCNRIRGDRADNLEQAIAAGIEALKVYTFDAFPVDWAMAQTNLANAYRERIRGHRADNLEQAIAAGIEALKVYTFDDFPSEWAGTQNNLGLAYYDRIRGDKAENCDRAIESYQNALKIRTKEDDPLNCLGTARKLANLYYNKKQWRSASEAYSLAIEAIENARLEALNPQSRQETLSNAIDVFDSIVQANLSLNKPEKALEYIERSKARNLVELMTQRNLKPQGVDRETIDKLNELRQQVVNEQIRLQNQGVKHNISSNDILTPYVYDYSHLKEYQQELDDFIDQQITPIDPTFKLTQKVEPIPFKDIQDLIDAETCLVEWYVTNEKILTFLVTYDSLRNLAGISWTIGWSIAPVKAEFKFKAVQFIFSRLLKVWQSTAKDLQNLLDWKDEYLETYEQNKTEWIKTLDFRLNKLSEILHLDEVLDLIPENCNKLILVPHYFLHIFPLHTLPLKNGKIIYDCFSKGVGYAPSCQLLQLVQQRKALHQEELEHLFAIQNPTRKDTKSLLGSNLEIARISQYFDLQNSTIISESEASETMLVELQEKVKSTHCLHFSCHGKFDSQSPLDSALLLADPEGNLGESANLTLAEIFEKLDLQKCRLVTLSACESGVVDPTVISDEYIGIPSGFLFAGSLSVVSTLWTVDPLATTLFMTKFYRNLQRTSQINELSVTIASNKAQTWLRNLSSKKLARIKDSPKFQQLLKESFQNQKRDYMKFKDLLEAAVKREPYPFANPYYWTAFIATGI